MGTINRQDFVEDLRVSYGLTSPEAKEMIDMFLDVLARQLITGKTITLYGVGTFRCIVNSGRRNFDINQRKMVMINPRKKIRFTLSSELEKRLNGECDA